MKNDFKPPFEIFALLFGLGVCISLVILSFGVAIAIVDNGLKNLTTIVSIVIWALMIACLLAILLITLVVFVLLYDKVKEESYKWIMAVLAIAAAFVTDISKELYSDQVVLKAAFAAMTGITFFCGSIIWNIKGKISKLIASLFFLSPPTYVAIKTLLSYQNSELPDILVKVDLLSLLCILGLFLIALLIIILSKVTSPRML